MTLSPEIANKAQIAASATTTLIKAHTAPQLFNLTGEAGAMGKGGTLLTAQENAEYQKIKALHDAMSDRLTNSAWTPQNQKQLNAFATEIKNLDKQTPAFKTAVLGKLLMDGARAHGDIRLMSDVLHYGHNAKNIQFTVHEGKNVPLETLLAHGIKFTGTAFTKDGKNYEVDANPERYGEVAHRMQKLAQVEAREKAHNHAVSQHNR